jgi:cell division protein FtsL
MSVDLEFAIKQDIRNNPVVREVDTEQKREFLRLLVWAAVVVLMLLVALMPRYQSVTVGYTIEDLREEVAREKANGRKYRLERETWLRPQVIEDRAIRELGMSLPTERDTLVLERVPKSRPVDRAIVAAVVR